ncbi:NUDIX domain-containing protein [Hoeflea olei]|uniref:Uncharacterized protein n=1 Tax=Hoeflea olei TaxID=1480615 RepID=A0A1C1YVN5_9HYPH|nr:NUDIX domain-containing protein [Hoeflea olei]OCW57555.1 hypothetical protein AWJ14_01670 [Hoeflea olei]
MPGTDLPENRVFALDAVQLRLAQGEHPWVAAEREAIAAHWAREQVERPFLFNGTILLHRGLQLTDGVLSGASHRAPYAALLHLVRTAPRADVAHLFGSALILSSDGAMILIRMAARTANAGKVYAPAGSLDESDIVDAGVDLDGSMRREVREETGLDLSHAVAEGRLFAWRSGWLVAVFRRFRLDQPAEQIAERVRAHIRTGTEDEIEDVVVVRGPGDAGPTVPPYMRAMIDYHFASPQPVSGWQGSGNH